MLRKPILAIILTVALVTMSCGFNINIPMSTITTGETQTEDILVDLPADTTKTTDVTLAFGAGDLTVGAGAENALVSGTATFNVPDFTPEVTVNGNKVRIEQGDLNIKGVPNFDDDIKNKWDLALGDAPIRLSVSAGAYSGNYNLGGLSLEELEINDGAANVDLSFDEPNQIDMDTFRYTTGASDVSLTGLANANFDRMIFHCGAGSYTLDFTGELQRDATVEIEGGISSIEIVVPEGVSAVVTFEGGLSNVDLHGEWVKNGDQYTNAGTGSTITIKVSMGAGNLNLRNK